ncbi:related to CYB2-L-lactate dehydrogenase (cytochrome b2) [Fusarium proliferatum]|nr:related to CYB2-L-lactate dehydrogenase (cytochrome b2) [Fusarium proliferatum]
MTDHLPPLPTEYARGLELIDAAHAQDSRTVEAPDGTTIPFELNYAQKMTKWLAPCSPARLSSTALPKVRTLSSSQVPMLTNMHRWEIPRSSYPMTRPGYLTWRAKLKAQAAAQVAELLASPEIQPPIPEEDRARVAALIRKENLKADEETQVLEDTACLVFLDDQFDDFEKKSDLDEAKMIGILQKTWGKMGERGRELALEMNHSDRAKELIGKALAG